MVARHHTDADAGAGADGDGLGGAGPRGVDHADQAEAAQARRLGRRIAGAEGRRARAVRDRQDTHAGSGHFLCRATQRGRIGALAHRQHALGGALDVDAERVAVAVERRGEAVLGLERDGVDLGMALEGRGPRDAELVGEREQGDVGGVAAPDPVAVALVEVALVAKDGGAGEGEQRGALGQFRAEPRHLASGREALAGDLEAPAAGEADLADGELVAGEGAGLVAGDERAAAEALDGAEAADDDAAPGQARARDGQRDGDGDGESLGDDGDDEGDAEEGHVGEVVVVERDADEGDDAGDEDRGQAEHAREAVEADEQRRAAGRRAEDVDREPPGARGLAGRDDQGGGASADHGGAGVDHVQAVGQGRGFGAGPCRVLVHDERFAGQERFVGFEAGLGEEAGIGRDAVARFEPEDIAGDDVGGVHFADFAAALHRGTESEQLAESVGAALGAPFLEAADDGVQDHHGADEAGVGEVADGDREERGEGEDRDEGADELAEEDAPPRRGAGGGHAVGAVAGEACRGFGAGEPGGRGVERGEGLVGRDGVPGEVRRRRVAGALRSAAHHAAGFFPGRERDATGRGEIREVSGLTGPRAAHLSADFACVEH